MVTEHPIATADSEPGPLILISHDPANFLAKFVRLISDPKVFWRAGIDARCGDHLRVGGGGQGLAGPGRQGAGDLEGGAHQARDRQPQADRRAGMVPAA